MEQDIERMAADECDLRWGREGRPLRCPLLYLRFRHGDGIAIHVRVPIPSGRITEHQNLLLRRETFNALNHATFYVGDQNINSTSPGFGAITSTFYTPRVMEFGAHLTF